MRGEAFYEPVRSTAVVGWKDIERAVYEEIYPARR